MNPVYQNLRMSLSQADADLAEMRGQMAAQQAVVAELRSRVNTIPEVEAELARLNRDYEVNKTQYDTLLQRLESAKISESAEQNTESVKFRVIEPPTVPVKPSGPVRPALNSLVLLAALAAGLGLAILFSLMHPTFTTRDLLQKVTGIRVIGTVTAAVRVEPGALVSTPVASGGRRGRPAADGLPAEPVAVRVAPRRASKRRGLKEQANEYR